MKAAIYARISQDRTGQGLGVARQIEECETLAHQRGIQVLHTLTDNDTSAYKKSVKRPSWNKVLDLVQSGDVDTIIVWNLDRAYRRLADLQDLLEQIQDRSVMILAVQGGALDLTTPPGRAMANVMASMAQLEVETKGERQALKHRELARAGAWKGGRKPWGYEKDGVTINPEESAAIKAAAQMIINGSGAQATARWINDELGLEVSGQIPGCEVRKPISPVVLKRILMAPRIAGLRQHWSQKDRDRWERERRSGAHNGEPTPTGTLYGIRRRVARHHLRGAVEVRLRGVQRTRRGTTQQSTAVAPQRSDQVRSVRTHAGLQQSQLQVCGEEQLGR